MTRVVALARLEELARTLGAVAKLMEEIERQHLLARLQAEEPDRWDAVAETLRLARLPSTPGGVVQLGVALLAALEVD